MSENHPAGTYPQERASSLMELRWIFTDTWAVTCRDLQHWRLQPGPVIMGWFFPIMIVLMFGLLFGGAIHAPEGSSYFEYLMPGMYATTMLFGLETTMAAVTTDAARGITDRFRSMPLVASAVVLGRCAADMLNSLVGLLVMLVAGYLLGWRWHGTFGAAAGAIGLLLFLRFSLLWTGIFMGLSAKSPELVAFVQIIVWPISFLSNVFVDPATMPMWLSAIARWNPLSATTSATRILFQNPAWQDPGWTTQNAVPLAIAWPVVLIAIFLTLSVRKYRRLSR